MALTYDQYVTELASLAVIPVDNPRYLQNLPSIINYASLRIQRDLDLLQTRVSNSSNQVVGGSRYMTIPDGQFVVIEDVNILTPFGTTDPNLGTRNPCLQVS